MTPYLPSANLEETLRRWRSPVLIVGIVLVAASIVGAFFNPGDFFHGYLVGFLYWLAFALGSMAFLMLQYLSGGAWGVMIRRTLEAATRTLPLLTVFFIPLIFGFPYLYDWSHPERVHANPVLLHRSHYMNSPLVVVRALVYFAVWNTLMYFLNRWSSEEDCGVPGRRRLLGQLSAGGLILYVFTITFAAVDWAESLQTPFFSTIWGFLFVAGEALTGMAFVILAMWLLSRREPLSGALRPSHFHDLGKLLLMMVMVWAYFTFSQLVIIWAGDLPHEISYYLPRFQTSWGWLGVALIVVQFFVPFLLLLSVPVKRHAPILSGVSVVVLVMQFWDLIWMTIPGYHKAGFTVSWMTFTLPLGLGGIWLWAFFGELPKRPLLPANDPQLEEALVHVTE
ncbi:MAG TPA: hypothetical protein VMB03_23690 [Bryobacteraceae bacterium]|nr:hypothetical protein [Bryobacteraceae bacterium]